MEIFSVLGKSLQLRRGIETLRIVPSCFTETRYFFSILPNVSLSKLRQVRPFTEAYLLRLFFGGFNSPAVAQDASNHPEPADSNRRRTVNEHRPVRRIVHRYGFELFAIRYNFDAVRMIRLPRTIAGVAMHISSSEFLPSSLNSLPA